MDKRIKKTKDEDRSFLIRGFPAELYKSVKIRAIERGVSMKQFIIDTFKAEVERSKEGGGKL